MTSYCLSDLGLRDQTSIYLHRTGIFALAFAFLTVMRNIAPIFASTILSESPLFELSAVLIVTAKMTKILALFASYYLRVEMLTF
jgi:hypothetical protein